MPVQARTLCIRMQPEAEYHSLFISCYNIDARRHPEKKGNDSYAGKHPLIQTRPVTAAAFAAKDAAKALLQPFNHFINIGRRLV